MTYNWKQADSKIGLHDCRMHDRVQFSGYIKNLNKIATQRSGWDFERKNYGVSELWTLGRSEGYEVSSDVVGVDWGVGPPVPIPNTEVKHTFADNTCRVTGRKDR